MPNHTAVPDRGEFARWVHDALNRLYDSPYLQMHPLSELLVTSTASRLSRSQQVRQLLLDAIQSLRPKAGVPIQSSDWRAYRLLELRFIEGMTPVEAMKHVALGRSQFFGEQARVVDLLTEILWENWQRTHPSSDGESEKVKTEQADLTNGEIERLCAQAVLTQVDVLPLLENLRMVVELLGKTRDVSVHFDLGQPLILPHADRTVLRQAILNVITYAVSIVSGGDVHLSCFAGPQETGMRIVAEPAVGSLLPVDAPQAQKASLEICNRLLSLTRGTLHVEANSRQIWEAQLVWTPTKLPILLTVDDNEGCADLFRRYLANYEWQVIGAANGVEARESIVTILPTVIVLDVMMPQEDGWELLIALGATERTRLIPKIICSVLNEPDLARTLGASDYLPKPVSQQSLLRALAPWSQGGPSRGSAR